MYPSPRVFVMLGFAAVGAVACAQGPAAVCTGSSTSGGFFQDEVWSKVASRSCLECHKTGGEADDSKFILRDPAREPVAERGAVMEQNRLAFGQMAARKKEGQSRLLLKATGKLSHGGEEVVKADSPAYGILSEFVRRASLGQIETGDSSGAKADFLAGVTMLDDQRLLRRVSLSLVGRLPNADETGQVARQGLAGVGAAMDGMMKEEAFLVRLAEAFNDILLIRGYGDPIEALSYENFHQSRLWNQKFSLEHIQDAGERRRAGYKLTDDYYEALLREPLELIKYIVKEERPFTEILTAKYIMVSPYSARGYGVYGEVHDLFRDPEDPFEYVPVQLKALQVRGNKTQPTLDGYYPHAGILSTFQYLRRYPTTETNRNRLRARMFYEHFLGVDVLELAARVTDAAAVTAKFEVPTMQAAECVVCHRTLDPVASLFQDYYSFEGVYGPRKAGWFKDMFNAGFEGSDLPEAERLRGLPWLAEQTIHDPRFATTMVQHAWYVLTGRKALLPPKDLDDPLFGARNRAYQAQHREIERIAVAFAKANFSFKEALKLWVASPFYRADGVETGNQNPERLAELADIGLVRILSPEQLERKTGAIFGKPWGQLKDNTKKLLYGGIDSKQVTERAPEPNGVMGALQRTMANDLACRYVPAEFALPAAERHLFPTIEPAMVPGNSPQTDVQIHVGIAHLHKILLGQTEAPDSAEVERTYQLFASIIADAQAPSGKGESYAKIALRENHLEDSSYTVRAWIGVVTYLLRNREFLYE